MADPPINREALRDAWFGRPEQAKVEQSLYEQWMRVSVPFQDTVAHNPYP